MYGQIYVAIVINVCKINDSLLTACAEHVACHIFHLGVGNSTFHINSGIGFIHFIILFTAGHEGKTKRGICALKANSQSRSVFEALSYRPVATVVAVADNGSGIFGEVIVAKVNGEIIKFKVGNTRAVLITGYALKGLNVYYFGFRFGLNVCWIFDDRNSGNLDEIIVSQLLVVRNQIDDVITGSQSGVVVTVGLCCGDVELDTGADVLKAVHLLQVPPADHLGLANTGNTDPILATAVCGDEDLLALKIGFLIHDQTVLGVTVIGLNGRFLGIGNVSTADRRFFDSIGGFFG